MAGSTTLTTPHHTPPLRGALRIATSEVHAALDESLSGALANRGDYLAFLRASRDAVVATADALARVGIIDAAARIAAIDHDLVDLDAMPVAPTVVPAASAGVASDWGVAYVVEGSALGGRVLADALDARLALEGRALAYLRLRGEHAGRAWRAFVARLDAFGADATDQDLESTVRAAHATFALYTRAFAAHGLVATA